MLPKLEWLIRIGLQNSLDLFGPCDNTRLKNVDPIVVLSSNKFSGIKFINIYTSEEIRN